MPTMLPSTTNHLHEYIQLCKLDIAKGLDVGTSYVNRKGAALLMKTISVVTSKSTMNLMNKKLINSCSYIQENE